MKKMKTTKAISREVEKLKTSGKKIAAKKKTALSFLIQAGIYTEKGNLKKVYK